MDLELLKQQAAEQAASQVKSGMHLGLGSGTTSRHAILALGRRVRAGELSGLTGVATSVASEQLAREQGLEVGPLDARALDLAIDGADEVDSSLNLIKGLGGALLREKLVESQAKTLLIIVDASKPVSRLGEKGPLPIEIVPFAFERTLERLSTYGMVELRREEDGQPFVTDGGNFIAHLRFSPTDVYALERQLKGTLGVVETGFFLGMATQVLVAHPDRVESLERSRSRQLYGEDK